MNLTVPTLPRLWQYFSTIVGLIFRHPITGVAVIPILADSNIVLIQRRDNQRWAFPGGFIDWGEDIKQTATREIYEETGLSITSFGRLVGVYSSPKRDPRVHSICIAIVAYVEGEFDVVDRGEVLEVKSFEASELPRDVMSHDHDQLLNDFLTNQTGFS